MERKALIDETDLYEMLSHKIPTKSFEEIHFESFIKVIPAWTEKNSHLKQTRF